VIASDIPVFRASCGDAALYFPLDRPDRLAEHLGLVMADPSTRDDLQRRGHKQLATLHVGSATERIVAVLDDLTGG
jgi:hypothetical protein